MYLKRSCCCYSLQHGAIVIGITVMVASAVALMTEVGMIAEWEDIKESLRDPRMQQCKSLTNPVISGFKKLYGTPIYTLVLNHTNQHFKLLKWSYTNEGILKREHQQLFWIALNFYSFSTINGWLFLVFPF